MSNENLVEDITRYMAAASTQLTKGVTLFSYGLPEGGRARPGPSTSLPVVGVFEEIGFPPIERFGSGVQPAFNVHRLRAIVRSTEDMTGDPDPRNSRRLASDLHRIVSAYEPNSAISGALGSVGDMTWQTLSPPYELERDGRGRWVWTFGFIATVAST